MQPASYASMDEALEIIAAHGPDLSNGMTSHAPMATEALCAMGRSDAVLPWLAAYRRTMTARPAPREPIPREHWRAALGQYDRVEDWFRFFRNELAEAPWAAVLDRWTARLAPGISASATHGVLRVGHAVRSLAVSASAPRLRELADGLALWASTYEELPTRRLAGQRTMRPREAIAAVAVVPPERRRFAGTITSSLQALSDVPDFAPVIGLLDVGGDAGALVSELTDTFARVYLANARDVLTAIVFVHGVTSIAAVRSLLPHLEPATAQAALGYAWQTASALYAAFGSRPEPVARIEPPREDADTLVELAIAHGDEHAIKLTEACLREHALAPSPAYLAAARQVLNDLRPG